MLPRRAVRSQGEHLLCQMLGRSAVFREGQWEAISAVVEQRRRVLLVQRTGWGKSIVYFLATKLLREAGGGPTLIVSPLLSLMRNQISIAERIGIRAETINSDNKGEWDRVERALVSNACDVLLVAPERLANERFLSTTLPAMSLGAGLLVVDEAHCISDWGHDFRPDYRRITGILGLLPPGAPVLATTATANNRVVADVEAQLGRDILTLRGPLARSSLRLENIHLSDQSERLAWLADHLPRLPGSGIVYCLTIADTERVARWLRSVGINARAYHAGLVGDRPRLEMALIRNELKVLVATVALGMGFDKPDLGFVIHYQRPGSVVAYYQQVGRAGRAVDDAYGILLSGREDDEIQEYFISTAFPGPTVMSQVVSALEAEEGLSLQGILRRVNLAKRDVERSLKLLEVDGIVARKGGYYFRTANRWNPDLEREARITEQRWAELRQMQEYMVHTGCLMEFLSTALDDPAAAPCGRCSNCSGEGLGASVRSDLIERAIHFLQRDGQVIEPRRQWPPGVLPDRRGRIPDDRRCQEGRALCIYGDAGWARLVRQGKYEDNRFSDELVRASAKLIHDEWDPQPYPTWVAAIPSLRRPILVPDFARRLADALELPCHAALVRVRETPEQKTMANSVQQLRNVAGSLRIEGPCLTGPVLLVDDIVDSRWTITEAAWLLRSAGSGVVYPFALAVATQRGD